MYRFVLHSLCATFLLAGAAFADTHEGPLPPGKAANPSQGGEYASTYTIGAVGAAGFVIMGVALTISGNGDGPVTTTSTTTTSTTTTTSSTSTATSTSSTNSGN